MRLYDATLLFLALATTAHVAEPPTQDIELPVGPVIPTPMPPTPLPAPGVYTLNDGEMFVVGCAKKCRVKVYPDTLVSVSAKTGPRDISGKFAGGKGLDEDRSFAKPFLYVIKASGKGSGTVKIEITPYGFTDDSQVVTTSVDVNSGQGPQPPPTPDPSPDVKPTSLWGFVIVEETSAAVASRGALLSDSTLSAFLKTKGYHWRIVDKDVVGADGKPPADVLPALNASKGKTLPQLFVIDTKGNIVNQANLTDAAGIVAALTKYGGK